MEKMKPAVTEAAPEAGALLARYFKEKRTRKSVLARLMGVRPQTILGYQMKKTMQTATLWKLSIILKHNFLLDMAYLLPKEFSTFAKVDTSLSDRIAALEVENEKLRNQNEVLERLMRRF